MEQKDETLEEEIPGEISSEETTERKETDKLEKGEEKETEGRVIEIHPPPPFDEEALNPFIDVFMAKRGLADRKKAAVKLANVLFRMGYDPRKDIQNVTTYVNNLSTVLSSMPDTAETMPVKGALLARGAVDTAGMLNRSHFGERNMRGVDPELQQMLKFAQNAKVTMKILDSAFAGDSSSGDSSEMKELKTRLNRLEGDKVLDAKLAPLHTSINTLQHSVDALVTRDSTRKPAAEDSPAIQKVTGLLAAMDKRLDGIDQRYQFTTEIQGIRNELTSLKTTIETGGGKGGVTDVFDEAVKLMDKIKEVTTKYGGGEGELDWRVAAITGVSEIATEAIAAAKDIQTAKTEEELREKPAGQKEPISDRIVDRRLLSLIQAKVAKGEAEFNSVEAAKALGVTEKAILSSYERLKEKGILRSVEPPGKKKEEPKSDAEKWVSG